MLLYVLSAYQDRSEVRNDNEEKEVPNPRRPPMRGTP